MNRDRVGAQFVFRAFYHDSRYDPLRLFTLLSALLAFPERYVVLVGVSPDDGMHVVY